MRLDIGKVLKIVINEKRVETNRKRYKKIEKIIEDNLRKPEGIKSKENKPVDDDFSSSIKGLIDLRSKGKRGQREEVGEKRLSKLALERH